MSARIVPIGGLVYISGVFNISLAYTEFNVTPLPDWLWLCDGSQIVDATSPLNGKFVPDLSDRVLRSGKIKGSYGDSEPLLIGGQKTESYDGLRDNDFYKYDVKCYMRIK